MLRPALLFDLLGNEPLQSIENCSGLESVHHVGCLMGNLPAHTGRLQAGETRLVCSSTPQARLVLDLFKGPNQFEAVVKRYNADDPEGAVDQTPTKWYLAQCSADEGQRDNEHAGDHTGPQNPDVPHWIDEWTDKEDSDDDMCKRQPIGAIRQPGMLTVAFPKTVADGENPVVKAVAGIRGDRLLKPSSRRYGIKFALEGKCRNPAHDKSKDEEAQHHPEPAEGYHPLNCLVSHSCL